MLATNPFFSDLAAALDPVDFAQSLGIDPDPWQEDILRSDSKRIILNCARQTGKSSVVAIIALHHALYHPKAMVIIISHTLQQAAETFRKVHDYYRQIAKPVLSIIESVHRLELTNGSRIVTLTGQAPDSIRGFSNVSLLIIDEASQVPDEAYYAARPMVAVNAGRIILLSTPHGQRGFYWQAWANEDDWEKVEINADQCPRLTKAFIVEEKALYPSWLFRQEYYNEFAEGVTSVFRAEDIDAAFDHPELPTRWEIDLELD
jgi:phage terminase large subunit-like protein